MNRIEGYQFHLLYIRFAIFGQIFLVTEDIDDFCYEVIACLTLVKVPSHDVIFIILLSFSFPSLSNQIKDMRVCHSFFLTHPHANVSTA